MWCVSWVCPSCNRRGVHTGRPDVDDPEVVAAAEELGAEPEDFVSIPSVVHCVACEAAIELEFSSD